MNHRWWLDSSTQKPCNLTIVCWVRDSGGRLVCTYIQQAWKGRATHFKIKIPCSIGKKRKRIETANAKIPTILCWIVQNIAHSTQSRRNERKMEKFLLALFSHLLHNWMEENFFFKVFYFLLSTFSWFLLLASKTLMLFVDSTQFLLLLLFPSFLLDCMELLKEEKKSFFFFSAPLCCATNKKYI